MTGAGRFIDSYGFSWKVAELPSSVGDHAKDSPAAAEGTLYFFSGGSTHVVREYPRAWQDLSWPELEDLLARSSCLARDVTRPNPVARGSTALAYR
jgi:hypothetical protein